MNRLRRRLMNLVSLRISPCRQAPCREEATCSITAESAALQSADQRGQRPGTGRWHENQGPLMNCVWPISSQHGDSWPMRGLGETSVRLCQAVLSVWARDIFAIVGVSESGLQQPVLQCITDCSTQRRCEARINHLCSSGDYLRSVICCQSDNDNNHVERSRASGRELLGQRVCKF